MRTDEFIRPTFTIVDLPESIDLHAMAAWRYRLAGAIKGDWPLHSLAERLGKVSSATLAELEKGFT